MGSYFDFRVSGTGTLSTIDTQIEDYSFLASYAEGELIGPDTVGTVVTDTDDWDAILVANQTEGAWTASHDVFLGFVTQDDLYGWISYSYTRGSGVSTLELRDGAYQASPGIAILAGAIPEPSAIALLVGAGAWVSASRRRLPRR